MTKFAEGYHAFSNDVLPQMPSDKLGHIEANRDPRLTYWTDITDGGKTYSMSHLHPFNLTAEIGGKQVEIQVTFGWHVFTDEKNRGKPIRQGDEERYFSISRYNTSHTAVEFIQKRMISSYVRPYFDKNTNENYFCLDVHDFAVFMAVHKAHDAEDTLKCRVISAYDVDEWGRPGLPRTKAYKMRYVLDVRNQGLTVDDAVKARGKGNRR